MLAGVAISVACWLMFRKEYAFHHEQRPGFCSDARLQNQTLREARFFIDDRLQSHGVVTMRCAIPVHIYPCTDDGSSSCGVDTVEPPLPTPRSRYEATTVRCRRRGGVEPCAGETWHCFGDRACDAYEKAQRLCIHKLQKSPYMCYYVPDSIQAGQDSIRLARRGFPIWLLLGSIVASLGGIALCWFGAAVLRDDCETHGPSESIAQSAYAVLSFSCIMAVMIVCLFLLSGVPDSPLGQVAVEVVNLTRVDEGGNEILPEEEPVPETPWWQYMLVMLVVFSGVAVLFACLMRHRGNLIGEEDEEEEEVLPSRRFRNTVLLA